MATGHLEMGGTVCSAVGCRHAVRDLHLSQLLGPWEVLAALQGQLESTPMATGGLWDVQYT